MTIDTMFGPIEAAFNEAGALTALKFGAPAADGNDGAKPAAAGDHAGKFGVGRQLAEYFAGRRTSFDLPLAPEGTDFQKRVWSELMRIPYGETISYGELARRVGRSGGARAVGRANATNPIAVVVPCHRVIGSGGELTGYAYGVELKRRLLDLERGQNRL